MTTAERLRGLYAIADTFYLDDTRLLNAVREALDGGARIVQYRDKTHDTDTRRRQAGAIAALCRQRQIPFIVNDDVELTKEAKADGVHIGHEDVSLKQARSRLGDHIIIGVSCYNDAERALRAAAAGADYVAFGSFFPSTTKPNAVRADLSLLRAVRAQLSLPIVAIGGITPDNGGELIEAGADALAVISGVFDQTNVTLAAQQYAALF